MLCTYRGSHSTSSGWWCTNTGIGARGHPSASVGLTWLIPDFEVDHARNMQREQRCTMYWTCFGIPAWGIAESESTDWYAETNQANWALWRCSARTSLSEH
jgi:hypothetical protein